MQNVVVLCVTYVMVFSRVLVDDVVEAIFDDFGLSDEDESDFEGGDDIHALLGETVLRCEEVMDDYMDEENTSECGSEGKCGDNVDMLESSGEQEGKRGGFSHVSDSYRADPYVRRITGGERQRREIGVRKPKAYTNCSV